MSFFERRRKQHSVGAIGVWAACLVFSAAPLCPAARGQQIDVEHGPPGSFVLGIDQRIGPSEVLAAQRQAALAIAGKVRDILQQDPAVSSPIGYSVRVNPVFGKVTDWANFDSGLPFFAGAVGRFFEGAAKPSPTAFSGPEFGIYVNTVLQCPLNEFSAPGANGKHWLVNGNLPVLMGGRRTGEFRGFTVYDGQCAILGRSNLPAFVPLTREQYMGFEIAMLKEKLDDARKRNSVNDKSWQDSGRTFPPGWREAEESAYKVLNDAIAQQEQELASMDADTRSAPAAVQTGYMEAKLVGVDEAGAILLSTPNPAFFDRSLPAATVQSIAVYVPFLESAERAAGLPSGLGPEWQPPSRNIRDQLDWAALAALVRQP